LTAESLTVNNDVTLGSSNTDTLEVRSRITTDLEPNANNARDIGTSGRNWRDGFFGRNLSTVNLEVTGTTSFDGQQGTSGQVLTSAGAGATPTWTTLTASTTVSDDTTTNASYYPTFSTATSGTFSTATVSSTKLTYNPSLGDLRATQLAASNGIMFTNQTINTSVTFPTGYDGISGKNSTIASGVTVTVPSGATWTIV
jgi:hypothetical protein